MATKPGANANARTVYNTLRSRGYSPQAAAGVVGNLQQESGVNPNSNQAGGPGRGIAQWSEGARWEDLKRYSGKKNPQALGTQVDFMIHEMQGLGQGPGSSFAKSTSVNRATLSFEKVFERAGTPNMTGRYNYANNAYAAFSGNPVSKTPPAAKSPAKPYSAIPGIHAGTPATPGRKAPVPKLGAKAGTQNPIGPALGSVGDNLVPDGLGGWIKNIPDNITPDNMPNPVEAVKSPLEAVQKITTTIFSVSFWIRVAFIVVGLALVFIGTKALLSGGAPQMTTPQAPDTGPPPSTPRKASKPFGSSIKKGAAAVAVAVPK